MLLFDFQRSLSAKNARLEIIARVSRIVKHIICATLWILNHTISATFESRLTNIADSHLIKTLRIRQVGIERRQSHRNGAKTGLRQKRCDHPHGPRKPIRIDTVSCVAMLDTPSPVDVGKGQLLDNAQAESFFSRFKTEVDEKIFASVLLFYSRFFANIAA